MADCPDHKARGTAQVTLGILIPAAGASSRMRGRDKLIEQIDGVPLLLRQLRACQALDLPVLVTLPPDNAPRHRLLPTDTPDTLSTRTLADAATGLSASLRAGADWAIENAFSGVMIVLPDMPDLTTPDLAKVAQMHMRHPSDVIRASDPSGRDGHPTVIPARLLPEVAQLQGDFGARDLLKAETIRRCPLPGAKALTDLDTPEDWEKWRAARVSVSGSF